MRYVCHVACLEEKTYVCRVLVGKLGERPLGRPRHRLEDNIVTCRRIARQRLGKHIPADTYAGNNRTFIARQRISKQAFSTREAALSVPMSYKGANKVDWESCCCEELGRVLEVAVQGEWEEIARKGLDRAKKILCMIYVTGGLW
jgi:hypothetical protein